MKWSHYCLLLHPVPMESVVLVALLRRQKLECSGSLSLDRKPQQSVH
jgi:hypothetical protein